MSELTDILHQNEVDNIVVNLKGWSNGGYFNNVCDKLEGFDGMSALTESVSSKARVAVSANMSTVYNDSPFDSFSAKQDVAKYLSKQLVSIDNLTLTTNEKNSKFSNFSYYVLSPNAKSKYFNLFLDSISKKLGSKDGLSIENIVLNADYSEKAEVDRQTALTLLINDLQTAKSKTDLVLIDNPFAPLIRDASILKNFPCGYSGYNIESVSIPFYAMVVHGYKEYTAAPINNAQNSNLEFLQAVESGAGLSLVGMDASSETIKNTPLSSFYSLEYSEYIGDTMKLYEKARSFYEDTKNSAIEHHTYIYDHVALVQYENKSEVIVNYSDKDVDYNGLTVPAHDFVFRGGQKNE